MKKYVNLLLWKHRRQKLLRPLAILLTSVYKACFANDFEIYMRDVASAKYITSEIRRELLFNSLVLAERGTDSNSSLSASRVLRVARCATETPRMPSETFLVIIVKIARRAEVYAPSAR